MPSFFPCVLRKASRKSRPSGSVRVFPMTSLYISSLHHGRQSHSFLVLAILLAYVSGQPGSVLWDSRGTSACWWGGACAAGKWCLYWDGCFCKERTLRVPLCSDCQLHGIPWRSICLSHLDLSPSLHYLTMIKTGMDTPNWSTSFKFRNEAFFQCLKDKRLKVFLY